MVEYIHREKLGFKCMMWALLPDHFPIKCLREKWNDLNLQIYKGEYKYLYKAILHIIIFSSFLILKFAFKLCTRRAIMSKVFGKKYLNFFNSSPSYNLEKNLEFNDANCKTCYKKYLAVKNWKMCWKCLNCSFRFTCPHSSS